MTKEAPIAGYGGRTPNSAAQWRSKRCHRVSFEPSTSYDDAAPSSKRSRPRNGDDDNQNDGDNA